MNTAPVRSALARKTGLDARTVAGLAAMILFFIISGSITYFNVRVLVEDSARIQHSHTVIRSIDDLLSRVQDAETGQRGYLLTGHDRYLEPYRAAVAGLPAQLDEVASLIAGNPAEVARMIVLRRHIRDKFAELAETIELRRTSGVAPALTVLNSDRGKIEMDAIREQLGLMLQEESRLRGEGIAAMAGAYRVVWLTIAVTGLVGIALAIAIGALVRRVALERDRRDWLLSGRIELGGAVLGDLGVGQLGDNILAFLARFLGAEAGAIFIGDGSNYRRIATYGVPSDAGIVQNFARGEGVLGQVVTDDAPTVLSDVPEGYLTIGSALGRDRPRHLAIAPAHADGVVQGVVELGFLHRIDDRALELLTESAGAIGIALRSARYRGELQNLLEETQRQSEELQVQSEELRVSNEELEEQSRALRDSQGRLEQQQAELEQTNVQLEEQAQQLEAQRDDLARSNAAVELKARELEQASRYKSDFLANMSHELRTPLNSLLILSKLLGDNAEDNLSEEQVNYARTIHSSGNDLLGLINDILDLSKIEAGHVQIRPETVALERLATDLRPLFQPVADERHLQFEIGIAPDCPPTMDTDRQRLEQILKNLLSNAFKFTAEGSVRLTIARAGDDRLAFAVTDTGIGIPAEQQRGIFEAFHQADGTISRRYGGTGLGLSISRELARLLGATIALESTEGQGSSFTVTLPLGYDPALVAPRDASQAASPADPVAAIRQSPPARPPRPATLPRRVDDDRDGLSDARRILLVVEDDAAFAGIVRDLAREMGFQCLVAGTAEEALDLARKYRPNAVVLDVGLPDQSGLAVLDRLKRDVATRHIPVHVISGADHTQTALSLGAIGYLMKPVKHEELATVLDSLSSTLTRTMRRVLIVEDDPRQREAVGKLLASGEVETVGAGTAAECLERLKEQTFDCMVLDLNLPDATGFSLLETLRADGDHAFPPVIVYTGHDLSPEQEQRLRRYSDSIIIKGARSPERLLDEVSLFLHQVVNELPPEQQKMIQKARSRDAILEGRRILIVEDDVRNVYSLTNILEPRGAIVEIARNGREAIDALDKAAEGAAPVIDLVLMDVMMPVMDGLTATRTIREDGRWRRLPIIMLTAKAMPDDHERCIEAGANDYMAKPLDVDKLLSLVRVWMPR